MPTDLEVCTAIDGDGTFIFYSDTLGGIDAPVDTALPADETGPESANTITYTPSVGQPGYGQFPVTPLNMP